MLLGFDGRTDSAQYTERPGYCGHSLRIQGLSVLAFVFLAQSRPRATRSQGDCYVCGSSYTLGERRDRN